MTTSDAHLVVERAQRFVMRGEEVPIDLLAEVNLVTMSLHLPADLRRCAAAIVELENAA